MTLRGMFVSALEIATMAFFTASANAAWVSVKNYWSSDDDDYAKATIRIQVPAVVVNSPWIRSFRYDFQTQDGTAVSGEDYQPRTDSIVWSKGQYSGQLRSLRIDLLHDGHPCNEPEEKFYFVLKNPQFEWIQIGGSYKWFNATSRNGMIAFIPDNLTGTITMQRPSEC